MKNLFKTFVLTSFLCISLLFSCSAGACVCNEYFTPPCAAYWRADAVFIGTLVEIAMPSEKSNTAGPPKALINFQVEKNFKGTTDKQIVTDVFVGSCYEGYNLKVGEKYLVYAHRNNVTGRFELWPCDRTGLLAEASADLDYINGLNKRKHQSISGIASGLMRDEMRGVKVIVKGDRDQSESSTDELGHYKISPIRTGNYRIQLIFPSEVEFLSASGPVSQISPTTLEYDVNLAENQCAYREVSVIKVDKSKSATISGMIVDDKGVPVPNTFVSMYLTTPNQDFSSLDYEVAKTDSIGKYSFNKVRPGQYLLGINLGQMPDFDTPYPQTFFPGVATRDQATIITVTENQQLSLPPFKLLPKPKERIVTGKLLWPDGTSVNLWANHPPNLQPMVYLLDPKNLKRGALIYFRPDGSNTIQIDEDGRFSFVGYDGYTYVVHAHAFNAQNEPVHAKHIKVKVTDNIPPLELILSVPGIGKNSDEIKRELQEQSCN